MRGRCARRVRRRLPGAHRHRPAGARDPRGRARSRLPARRRTAPSDVP
jgi:hypothetical protein